MDANAFIQEVHNSGRAPESFDVDYGEFQIYQKLAWNTLKEFVKVCNSSNIRYELAYGSLLGAIRDKGQIPWDYDIDVFIRAEDRKRLIEALSSQLDDQYYFFCPEADSKCTHSIIRLGPKGYNTAYLHVDVFFLMALSEDEYIAAQQRKNISEFSILYKAKSYNPFTYGHITRKELKLMMSYKIKGIGKNKSSIWNQYLQEAETIRLKNSKLCCSADRFSNWYDFPSSIMENTDEVNIMGELFSIPSDYDQLLRIQYGYYESYPPLEKRLAEMYRHLNFLRKNCPLKGFSMMEQLTITNRGGYRKYWIDALRGLAMLFVIFGHHCPEFTEYFVITSPIKIPMFFAITGYVFNGRDGDVKGFFRNLFWKLIVPWFFLSLLPLKLINAAIHLSVASAGRYIYEFISGGILWYMPCCILAEIIQFFVRKFCKGWSRYVVMIGIAVLGLILAHFEIGSFAGFNTACIAQVFIAVGLWLKEENVLRDKRGLVLEIGTAVYIIGVIITLFAYPGQNLDVHTNSYYNPLICAVLIVAGCVACFIGAEWFDEKHPIKKNSPLVSIGQNTLVYYMFCSYVIKVWDKGLRPIHLSIPVGPIEWIINTVVMCIGYAVIAVLINRFAPILVGKRKKTRD